MASICPFSSSVLMASICPFSSSELMASICPLLQAISQTKLKAFSPGRTNPVKSFCKEERGERTEEEGLSVCLYFCLFYLSVCLYGVVVQAHKQGGVVSRREGQSQQTGLVDDSPYSSQGSLVDRMLVYKAVYTPCCGSCAGYSLVL